MLFTTSEKIKNTIEYKKIQEIIERMDRTNLIWLGRGQCISMSDVICAALFQAGIKSKMVECQVFVTNENVNPSQSVSVGYDNSLQSGQIDTHVVVVTDTETPIIIDASLSYLLPDGKNILVDEVVNLPNRVFCDVKKDGFSLTYQQKTSNKVIFEHQKSIIERIETDRQIFKNLKYLKIFIIIALVLGSLNFLRGSYDFYQVYYNDNSLRGISGTKEITDRLEIIEETLKNN
jgi:hypothetical protein